MHADFFNLGDFNHFIGFRGFPSHFPSPNQVNSLSAAGSHGRGRRQRRRRFAWARPHASPHAPPMSLRPVRQAECEGRGGGHVAAWVRWCSADWSSGSAMGCVAVRAGMAGGRRGWIYTPRPQPWPVGARSNRTVALDNGVELCQAAVGQ